MSAKDTLKAIPAKLKTAWNENKDTVKNTTIAVLATTSVVGYLLLKAVSVTRDDYLESKGLTQDFDDYLTAEEDEES